MADEKLTALFANNPIDLDPGDLLYSVEHTATTPESGGLKAGQVLRERYKIVPTVSGNNLTLALKHLDGSDPSADRPLYFKIGDGFYAVTAALSVTKNAATNWAALGSAEIATKEQDLFVYIGRNATDGVTLAWARFPGAHKYSDFSTTSTNARYAAISVITNAAADDPYRLIGRFAATLSAGAGYTWSVPTYTPANLIQYPSHETRVMDWVPQFTGLTIGAGTLTAKYQILHSGFRYQLSVVLGAGLSVGSIQHSLPFPRNVFTGVGPANLVRFYDSNPGASYAGLTYYLDTVTALLQAQVASGTYLTVAATSSTVPFTWAASDEIAVSLTESI